MQNNLGQKIKKFRKRAGMSQLELEAAIGASPGSISRMESGKVNPSKETLNEISNALNISSEEAASLHGIEVFSISKYAQIINAALLKSDLEGRIRELINFTSRLKENYEGGALFIQEENNPNVVRCVEVSMDAVGIQKVIKILPLPLGQIFVDSKKFPKNFVVRSIKEKKILQTDDLTNFSYGFVNMIGAKLIKKFLTRTGSLIIIPFKIKGNLFGSMIFSKSTKGGFSEIEIQELILITEQISIMLNLKYEP